MCNIDKLTTDYSVMFDKSEVRSSEELNTGCRVVIQDKLNNDISLCVKGAGEFLRMQSWEKMIFLRALILVENDIT